MIEKIIGSQGIEGQARGGAALYQAREQCFEDTLFLGVDNELEGIRGVEARLFLREGNSTFQADDNCRGCQSITSN